MTLSAYTVARDAASEIATNQRRAEAIAQQYLDWIEDQEKANLAISALQAVAGLSKHPAMVLAAADQVYIQLESNYGDEVAPPVGGTEMYEAEQNTDFTTTNTDFTSTAAASKVPGLVAVVVGEGKPVDVRVKLPSLRHSVAATAVIAYLTAKVGDAAESSTGLGHPMNYIGGSPSTAIGRGIDWTERTPILLAGVTYIFSVGLAGGAAGTVSAPMAPPFGRGKLTVTRR